MISYLPGTDTELLTAANGVLNFPEGFVDVILFVLPDTRGLKPTTDF